ncbi:MAG: 2-C-methyl-D-erythritol 2,4-cyclodiphosphate synthase [Gemmatimonadaceae bacterium]
MPHDDHATIRVGIGYDSHRFAAGRPLILGGVEIPSDVGLMGHSDADAICHAITDAILGAAGLGDIGEMFPDSDSANEGRDSIGMLEAAVRRISTAGFRVNQVDVSVIAESPRLSSHRDKIRARLATALGIDSSSVSVKGKSNEGMGWIGRKEGLACIAVATLKGNR